MSGTLAGNGTGAGTEAVRWTGCWFVGEGGAGSAAGAESTSATDCVGDAAGRRDRPRQPWSPGWAAPAQGEGGRTERRERGRKRVRDR